MRTNPVAWVLPVVLVAGVACRSPVPEPSRPPNVLLVTLDTVRADRLRCGGDDPVDTPTIDAIAERGVCFSQATAEAPITLASHSSLLTGLNPNRHGARDNGTYRLDEAVTTLAEVLQAKGYATAAFVAAFTLDARFGLAQGFEVYDDDLEADHPAGRRRKKAWLGHERPYVDRPADAVFRRAADWLAQEKERPVFLWIHLFDAHAPYAPPEPFRGRFAGRPYDGEIAFVDHELGRFLERAGERFAEGDVIVIAADHGEAFGENGYEGHGERLHEPAVRVPLVVAKPGTLPRGAVVGELVRNVDVTPTILDLLGVQPDPGLDGRSLVPLAKGEKRIGPPPGSYAETLHPLLRGKRDELRSYRTEDWKYVRHLRDGVVQREELFSLSEDPGELHDRSGAPEFAAERAKLGSRLDEATREERSTPFESTGSGKPTGEIEQKLEALGYLD